jgi:hypothetical protein
VMAAFNPSVSVRKERESFESVRAGLERLESRVILSVAPVLPEVPDVDDRESPSLQP